MFMLMHIWNQSAYNMNFVLTAISSHTGSRLQTSKIGAKSQDPGSKRWMRPRKRPIDTVNSEDCTNQGLNTEKQNRILANVTGEPY